MTERAELAKMRYTSLEEEIAHEMTGYICGQCKCSREMGWKKPEMQPNCECYQVASNIINRIRQATPTSQAPGEEGLRGSADLGDLANHGMNCPALTPSEADQCRCGLKYRRMLATERSMHRAWRKRAEEAESRFSPSADLVAAAKEAMDTLDTAIWNRIGDLIEGHPTNGLNAAGEFSEQIHEGQRQFIKGLRQARLSTRNIIREKISNLRAALRSAGGER